MKKIIILFNLLIILNAAAWGDNILNTADDAIILNNYQFKVTSENNPPAVTELSENWSIWDGFEFSAEDAAPGNMITLKTTFILNNSLENTPLGIYIGPTSYPCNIYVNGYLVFKSGQNADSWISGSFLSHDFLLPEKAVFFGTAENLLTIQIFPNGFNEALSELQLTTQKKASAEAFIRSFFSVYLIRATSFTSLLLAVYYLMLFFSSGKKELRFLYFTFLCLSFLLAYLEISFASDSFEDLVIKKISKIGFTLLLISLTNFIIEFTNLIKLKRTIKIFTAVPGVIFIIILIINKNHLSVDKTLGYMLNYYFPLIIIINLIILVYSTLKNKTLNNFLLLLALIGAISCAGHDITVILAGTIPYTYLTPYGFLLIIIALFVILTFEQLQASKENRRQAVILAEKNKIQEKMINSVADLSDYLLKSGIRLNDKICESSLIISENSVASKNMNNSIREQISSIEQTLPDIENNLGDSAEKILTALTNQNTYADEVQNTLSGLSSKMEASQSNLDETHKLSQNLNLIAGENRNVIDQSTAALREIESYSKIINDVLSDINDITERTDLLAMNASIEAAHAGNAGKGFAVVAGEVRNLSTQSKTQITESNKKISGMDNAIKHSRNLSNKVSEGLYSIINEAVRSSAVMEKTRSEIELQQTETGELLRSVQNLIEDTFTIKGLSEESRNVNKEVQRSLKSYRETLFGFSELIDKQESKIEELKENMIQIEELFKENLKYIDNLKAIL